MSGYLETSKRYKQWHYSVLKPEMLSYLHSTGLEMLRAVSRVFEANNIAYMICGGTLLGAVTSGKFIAWDDDVDLCVMDDDFDRAIDILCDSLPEWMFVQCAKTEPKYFHGWVKVRDINSHVYPDTAVYKHNGVWLDIYRLISTTYSGAEQLIASEHLDYLNRRYKAGDISFSELNRRIADNNLVERVKISNCCNRRGGGYMIRSASSVLVEKEWCFPRKRYNFEGMELYSFKDAGAYLTRHYGESYRTLPPEGQRRIGINRITF